MKVLVLVDGEHYPPVTAWGIQVARSMGHEVIAALFIGGSEKVAGVPELGVPVRSAADDVVAALRSAISETDPEAVLDLSDEPVLGYRERMELVSVTLAAGRTYLGSDFRFDPPAIGPGLEVPSIAVIGTGKRTGKTAIAGHVARRAAAMGRVPVVVAMGRGGPAEPQVAEAGSVTVERLLQLVANGQHAASDYLEDALMAGVTTVGARRCGGGMAGEAFATNAGGAARVAVAAGADLVILEGSGASLPPVPWDRGVLVVPAQAPPEYLGGYLGPYRLLRSDLVVFTMASGPGSRTDNLPELTSHARRWGVRYVVTDFAPHPMGDVRGKRVFFLTTAPTRIARQQAERLAATSGCELAGHSANLADRAALAEDLDRAPAYDVLATELKAAAVDVACRNALDRGAEVVFVDNRAETIDGDDLEVALGSIVEAAVGS